MSSHCVFRSMRRGASLAFSYPFTIIIALVASLPVLAQDEVATIWAINNSNGRLLQADFENNTTVVVNDDANEVNSGRALTFRSEGEGDAGSLFLANTLGGEVLFYAGASGTGQIVLNEALGGSALRPDGLDIDSLGNLFGVSGSPGESLPAQVWALERDVLCPDPFRQDCLMGGYKLPLRFLDREIIVDGNEVRLLSESLVSREANGPVEAGDLLVLAQDPALLLIYRRVSDTDADIQEVLSGTAAEMEPEVLIPTSGFPSSSAPSGIAAAPDGTFLISTLGGNILRYAADGTRLMPDFATNIGNGKFKIVVGPDAGEFKAYVASRNGGELLRFLFQPDGTGMLDATVNDGVQFPEDLVVSTANTVPAPAGSNIALSPSSVLQHIIEQILAAGATSATAFAIPDPRLPGEDRDLLLSELVPSLPDVVIPSFIRALPNSVGIATFVLVNVEADFPLFGLIRSFGDGAQVLGVDYDCNDPDFTLQPQLARAPDATDPPEPEGDGFANISIDCGTSRGGGREMSHYLIDVSDTRPPVDIAGFGLDNLDIVLQQASSCISSSVFKKLNRELASAERNFSRGRLDRARNDMLGFEAIAAASPSAFASCSGDLVNTFGNVRARALQIAYQLLRAQ